MRTIYGFLFILVACWNKEAWPRAMSGLSRSVASRMFTLPFLPSALFLILTILSSNTLAGNESHFLERHKVSLFQESGVVTLERRWQYFVNKDALSADEILSKPEQYDWKVIDKKNINFSYDDNEYWFRFRIDSQAEGIQTYILDIAYPLLDEIEIFEIKEDKINALFLTGDKFPFSERPIAHQNFIFPLKLNNTYSDFYIRLKTSSTVQVPLTLWPAKHFWEIDKVNTYMDGIFFGGIFIMILYNLFIYFSVRDQGYLFYVAYMIFLILVQAANRGVGYQFFWPSSPEFQNIIIIPALSGVVGFASLFFISLLNLKPISAFYYRFFVTGVFLCVFCGFSQLFFAYDFALTLTALISVSVAVGGSYIALRLWLSGNRLAGYYIAGWGVVIISFLIYLASVFNLLPRNIFIEYATMGGTFAEVIIFSFALADRINIERKMRIDSQAALLETQQEINKKLDVRVQQRTKELEIANAKLQEMSFSDGLTGVKNRRYFDEQLQMEYKRAYREQKSIALLLIDIDYFKAVNDKYGHQLGDDCLVAVAEALKNTMNRPGDTLARYGGEEFVVILPGTECDGARVVAEKFRKNIEALRISDEQGSHLKLTISIGLAAYVPKLRSGYENLLKRSDEELYRAKESGRNCVKATCEESGTIES